VIISTQRQERGVALITALLIVTISTILVVAMVSRQSLNIERSANLLHLEQARLYQMAVEDHAAPLLKRYWQDIEFLSSEEFEKYTAISGLGYQEQVEGGEIDVTLSFAQQGFFNLNNLLKGDKADPVSVAQFRRLLNQQNIETHITDAIIDWLDSDVDITYPDGAEDGYYLGMTPAYRTANNPMTDLSELLLVKGAEPSLLEKIGPYITLLPAGSKMNVNWMEGTLLMSLHDELTEGDAEVLIKSREEGAFKSVDEFLQHNVWAGKDVNELKERLTVSNEYFVLSSQIRLGEVAPRFNSLLKRDGDSRVLTLKRTRKLAG
jgi:general secretion pathway protein K